MLNFILGVFFGFYFSYLFLKRNSNFKDTIRDFFLTIWIFIVIFSVGFLLFSLTGCKSFSLHHDLEYEILNSANNSADVSES